MLGQRRRREQQGAAPLTLLPLLLCRTSTSCATGRRWSTWEASTTMQHNHSRRAGSPGLTSQECVKCPISATIPSSPAPAPPRPAPPPSLAPTWGRRKKRAFEPSRRAGGAQPITETHTDLIDHARFCFKNNKRSSLAAAVQTWRRRAAARQRRPVRAEPPPSLAATGSTQRAPSLLIISSMY